VRSLFRDAKGAVRFSTSAIQAFIPKHEDTLKTARKLERIGLFKGARYDELSQRLYELELEHAFACQLAVLAAAEGEVRQLADLFKNTVLPASQNCERCSRNTTKMAYQTDFER
jgi:hypothetical protein